MTIEIQQPVRKFRTGVTLLDDPDASLTPQEVLELYSVAYPHFKSATLGEPEFDGEFLIYPIMKPQVTTKGGGDLSSKSDAAQDDADLFEEILKWGMNANAPHERVPQKWVDVFSTLKRVCNRPQSMRVDPFLLPLA